MGRTENAGINRTDAVTSGLIGAGIGAVAGGVAGATLGAGLLGPLGMPISWLA